MVDLSTGESTDLAGGVIHTLTGGGMSVSVREGSRVHVCSLALLPEHGKGVLLAANVSSHKFGNAGH